MEAGEGKKKHAAFYKKTCMLIKAADVDLLYVSFHSLSLKNKIKYTAEER